MLHAELRVLLLCSQIMIVVTDLLTRTVISRSKIIDVYGTGFLYP